MTAQSSTAHRLGTDGPAAPPRSNGELVFAAPWERTAFGIALALADAGHYPWREFHQQLITEIQAWEQQQGHLAQDWHYYQRWLAALEYLLRDRGLINHDELDQKIHTMATLDEHHGRAGTRQETDLFTGTSRQRTSCSTSGA